MEAAFESRIAAFSSSAARCDGLIVNMGEVGRHRLDGGHGEPTDPGEPGEPGDLAVEARPRDGERDAERSVFERGAPMAADFRGAVTSQHLPLARPGACCLV